MTDSTKDVRDVRSCSVCGKELRPARKCKCPWNERFEEWPRALLNTVRALVAGGPRER